MSRIILPIKGMHCTSCEILISNEICKVPGVTSVKVNHRKGQAEINYKGDPISSSKLQEAVRAAGYDVGQKDKLPWISKNISDYKDLARAAGILLVVFVTAKRLNLFDLSVNSSNTGVLVALAVGLVAGLSTCMALIGGLVLSLSARHAEKHPESTPYQKFRPHLYFNLGRIIGYTLLGGLIGFLGASFKPSANLLGFLTVVVGGVMIFFGLKLIQIFPVLKDKNITLPSSIARLFGLNKEVKEYSHKGAMVMGGLTFFLPCGFTQAMQLYAVSTGSFWNGAAVMGLFALGTAPGLLGIGGLTSIFRGNKARIFYMTAGLAVILLGWYNISNGSRMFGGSVKASSNEDAKGDYQIVRMTQNGRGYSPNILRAEVGRPVKWIITSESSFSCATSIVMPKYGINKNLRRGENSIIFTPTQAGEIPFSCSMGMYRGKFIISEKGKNTGLTAESDNSLNSSGSCGAKGSSTGCGGCGGGGGGCGANFQSQTGATSNSGKEQIIKASYTYYKDIVPNSFTVKKGQPVKFVIDVKEDGFGCMGTILIPELYEETEYLDKGRQIVMTFTPTKLGKYPITCAMGVPRGEINVVE